MKNLNNTIMTVLTASAALISSCADDWDAHYGQVADGPYGNMTIYQVIANNPQLSDFREVLDSARLYANNHISPIHYNELLSTGQYFTVWAPLNNSFNKDSLLQLCRTAYGDSLVELHFLKNHIARYSHSAKADEETIKLFNDKMLNFNASAFDDSNLTASNLAANNGILHILEKPATYYYNVYEAMVSLDKYSHIGDFLRSYQEFIFDETTSIPMGVKDGKTVFADSVFHLRNILLNTYGHVDREDSLYWMLVPSRQLWDSLYEEAENYFNFGKVNKADSLHELYSHNALMQDLFYNPRGQEETMQDSIWSTFGSYNGFHTYYKPFEAGGLLTQYDRSVECSNGMIYEYDKWPFEQEKLYFSTVKLQGEATPYETYSTKFSTSTVWTEADSVSGAGYRVLTSSQVYDGYYATYEVWNLLSGTYDVYAVILPKTVRNPNYDPVADKKQFLPNKFRAEFFYTGTDGKEYTLQSNKRYTLDKSTPSFYEETTDTSAPYLFECNFDETKASTRAFTNDPYRVDTIKLATISIPTCSYAQPKTNTRIKIKNEITSREASKYSQEILLDAFFFKPHKEEK